MNNSKSYYRWFILALSALTFTFVVAMPTMCLPVLFEEIRRDLNLSLVQIGTVWGMASLAGMFVVLAGGLLGDRFGAKRVLAVSCLLAGLAGALRGLSGDFATLVATLFLFGLLTATIPPVVHKACGIWFSGRRLGLANGVVSMGMAVGFTIAAMISATVLSPALGGWRNVLFLYGGISVVIGILWLLTRSQPEQAESSENEVVTVPFRQALSRVARNRGAWLLGLILVEPHLCIQDRVPRTNAACVREEQPYKLGIRREAAASVPVLIRELKVGTVDIQIVIIEVLFVIIPSAFKRNLQLCNGTKSRRADHAQCKKY